MILGSGKLECFADFDRRSFSGKAELNSDWQWTLVRMGEEELEKSTGKFLEEFSYKGSREIEK